MNRLEEFFYIFGIAINTMNNQSIICSTLIGAALYDHEDFTSHNVNFKTLTSPRYDDSPYRIGYIDNISIYVDPCMTYSDMNVYTGNGKLIYTFSKFKPVELIK